VAGHEEIGHVGDRDQQHEDRRHLHRPEHRDQLGAGVVLDEADEPRGRPLVRLRVFQSQPLGDLGHLDLGPIPIDAVLEPADHPEPGAAGPVGIGGAIVTLCDPEILVFRKAKSPGHHTEHGRSFSVHDDRFPHDGRIGGIASGPDVVAEHHGEGRSGNIVGGAEAGPQNGPDAEDVEEIGRYERGFVPFGPLGSGEVDVGFGVMRQRFE